MFGKKISIMYAVSIILLIPTIHLSADTSTPPSLPFSIGGTVTINEKQLTDKHDNGYIIYVTKEDYSPYIPGAEDVDGLNAYDWYSLNIPVSESGADPDAAVPGDTAIIHVYKNTTRLLVVSPPGGRIEVGESSDVMQIDIAAMTPPGDDNEDCQDAVLQERERWDADGDNKIGLPEAIRALQIITGIVRQSSD